MDLSSDEAIRADAKTGMKSLKLAFGINAFTPKSRSSTGSIYAQKKPPSTPNSENGEAPRVDLGNGRALTRSRSEDITPRVRQEWGDELWSQEALRKSADILRGSVADYEEAATRQQWTDLLKVHADVGELEKLAGTLRKKRSKGNENESVDGLSKFSAVALEYSKMLDVVMNQSPEYAGLAWGAIRLLLVAHTNHSKLKHAVEHYLIKFGQEFGVMNQLMNSHPTKKMVEAISEAYVCFSKFLAKSVEYYKESKLKSAVKAFAFPWETRFQALVADIEAAFKRIREIASAGHFGVTVQTQQMVETISSRQEKLRLEMRQGTLELRQQLKLEMRDEVQTLFDSFDRNWISRFEQIMLQSMQGQASLPGSSQMSRLAAPPAVAALEFAESTAEGSPQGVNVKRASYLADFVMKPQRLKRFRDRSFPQLQRTDGDDAKLNAQLRRITTMDLQQIMGLLRNEAVRDWLQVSSSSLIWVNTYRRAGPADWATAFATRMIEYASKIDNMMVLYHLCGNHPTSDQVSTSTVVLQSIIMQVIQQHCKKFVRKVFPFTLEHFQDVHDDMEDLWELFSSCCDESRAHCVWLIIDNVNNLQKGEDYDNLLLGLQNLVDASSRVVKILISARANEAPEALLKAAIAEQVQGQQSSRRVAVVNVPRAQSSISAALLSKQKRLARIPDPSPNCESPSAKADIAGLLNSSEDDLISDRKEEEEEEEGFSVVAQSPGSITSTRVRAKPKSDDFSDLSDSSMEFTRVDPFATSEESDLGEAERRRQQQQQSSEDDIDNEEDVFFPSSRAHHHENPLLSSSDDDVHLAIPEYSKRKPRGRSNASRQPTRVQQSPLDMSASDGDESG